MAGILHLVRDERSAIGMRHAARASVFAAAGVAAGIFLTIAGNGIYERSSERVLWAQASDGGALQA
jgi:hypothetical protein